MEIDRPTLAEARQLQPDVEAIYYWHCDDCGHIAMTTMANVEHCCTPICPDCDQDMGLVEPTSITND